MYLIVRYHTGPITFSHEERLGPFETIEDLDLQAHPHRNNFWNDVSVEEGNIRRWYNFQDAAERRRDGR